VSPREWSKRTGVGEEGGISQQDSTDTTNESPSLPPSPFFTAFPRARLSAHGTT